MSARFRQAFHDTFVRTICPSKSAIFHCTRQRTMSTMFNRNAGINAGKSMNDLVDGDGSRIEPKHKLNNHHHHHHHHHHHRLMKHQSSSSISMTTMITEAVIGHSIGIIKSPEHNGRHNDNSQRQSSSPLLRTATLISNESNNNKMNDDIGSHFTNENEQQKMRKVSESTIVEEDDEPDYFAQSNGYCHRYVAVDVDDNSFASIHSNSSSDDGDGSTPSLLNIVSAMDNVKCSNSNYQQRPQTISHFD